VMTIDMTTASRGLSMKTLDNMTTLPVLLQSA
jgi:hypothetical protein